MQNTFCISVTFDTVTYLHDIYTYLYESHMTMFVI